MRKGIASAILTTLLLAGITLAMTAIDTTPHNCEYTAEISIRFDSPTYWAIIEENRDILSELHFNEVFFENEYMNIVRSDGKMLLKYKSGTDLRQFLGCRK